MGGAERVVDALGALGEAGQAAALAERPDAVAAPGEPAPPGLVVVGLLTMKEGGWADDVRETALSGMEDDPLMELVQQRITLLRRRIKQRKEAIEYAEKLAEAIG